MDSEYSKACKKGKKAYNWAILNGRNPFLPALDEFLSTDGKLPEEKVGLMEIPLSMVAGTRTRGRQQAFAVNFMPLLEEKSEFGSKWSNLYKAQIEEGIRDPVTAYEYMGKFYIQEGNKRVSVLKYIEVPSIMADITRIMPPPDEEDAEVYYEFLEFFRVAPTYEIVLTTKGAYKRLAEHMGRNLQEPWPEDVVSLMRYSFNLFCEAYHKLGGKALNITDGDAFLIYLNIYEWSSLHSGNRKDIEERVRKIWREFQVAANDDNIVFAEYPELEKKETLVDIFLKRSPRYNEGNPLRMAFIYDKDPEISRWIYGHELGRNHLSEKYPALVETRSFSGCNTEALFNDAVEKAIEDGCDFIFTPASAQMDLTLKAAVRFPKIKFMNCSLNLSHEAVRTYYGRMYEAKFLMGALAASMARNHRIGYVADYPIYGTPANINAFAIGAAMMDPFVKVHLAWSAVESPDWRDVMKEAGVQVLSGPDFIKPVEASREYGLYQLNDDGTIYNLAAPVWDWGKYYELIVETILRNTWEDKSEAKDDQALNYWWGMSAGVIDVILSKHLPYYSRKLVWALRQAVISETLNPFNGELHSQTGTIRGEGNVWRLSNKEIAEMNWVNDNVEGCIPVSGELSETGQKAVRISGVIQE